MVRIEISTENAAFGDHWQDRQSEVARILRALADQMEQVEMPDVALLRDINGNRIGSYKEG